MKFLVLALCVVAVSCDLVLLSADQAALVQSTWNQVRHSEVDILHSIFQAHPDIQARFPQFAGKDLDSLKDTAAFATHAGRIVGFISEIIALSGNEANAAASKFLIGELASSHKNRGIPQSQFNEFRDSLVAYLQQHVSWNDNVAAAWSQAIDNVFFILFSSY